jgi:hypothetical protein
MYVLAACPQINECFFNIYAKGEKFRGCMTFAQLAAKNRILRANASKICTRVAAGRKQIAGLQNVPLSSGGCHPAVKLASAWQTIENSYENHYTGKPQTPRGIYSFLRRNL